MSKTNGLNITKTDGDIFVGQRPMINYVMAIFNAIQRTDNIRLLARGRNINSACNSAEYFLRQNPEFEYHGVSIGTFEYEDEKGIAKKTSEIAICISKKQEERPKPKPKTTPKTSAKKK